MIEGWAGSKSRKCILSGLWNRDDTAAPSLERGFLTDERVTRRSKISLSILNTLSAWTAVFPNSHFAVGARGLGLGVGNDRP